LGCWCITIYLYCFHGIYITCKSHRL